MSRSCGTKITNFYPNWAFRDNNFSLNSPMHLKWCTKFHLVQKRCLIVFRGHSSNFKVCLIDYFNPIWVRLLGQSQLSNPSDLPCDGIAWKSGKIAIKCDGKSMIMIDNYLNMKEISKLLIFNYIISNYLCSYGDHSISTSVYLSIYLFIYQSIYLIHNISPVSPCSVKACLIKLPSVNLSPEAFS